METTQTVESSTNSTPNPISPQLENTNETTINNEELQDFQRVYSCPIPNFVQPLDNSPPVITPVPSGESVPVQLLLDPTTVGQESTTSIEVLIQNDGVVTISKGSSAKTFVKRSRAKREAMRHPLQCPEKAKSTNEVNLPRGSTEFNHRQESIPIDAKELCDIQKISRGEFGQVFSVVTKSSNAIPIAVKRIPSHQVKISEVEIMREVCTGENEYIIDYYCALFDHDDKYLYICMEYMDTSIDTFYKTMHQQNRLEFHQLEQFIQRVTHDVVSGLRYMERKEILHRDIKPANLLINRESYVKLCDFGISRSFSRMNLYSNNLNDRQYCELSPLLHTENYMPPTIQGKIQDDMWSFGITLIELVTGQNPFYDWKTGERFIRLLKWEPFIPEMISNDMQQLILDLLYKERSRHPSSYDDILYNSPILQVPDAPTSDECRFVCSIINIISRQTSPTSDQQI